ncbi:MAG: DUF547 domain-containing protein [Candidatus Scalindua sp. AMX11]|nr:MAG: DUF547 domain-containing protein [Candidatus Scalindua sp.]NOG83374.1 DUF547 domain-containing protein [Planctomycetota bacterium]RZV65538.1 MAG: DUF547 domain-containing protein [Candidatus Scalindua sp. SCAELEC01]TDE63524.1 MAG: DUF547 domain-containing protein [Candidatus Scalindua sp. AMX11]GJQ60578.1 MAG: DUF547 domain-containing protein [Candidatus Scalindua sp.]
MKMIILMLFLTFMFGLSIHVSASEKTDPVSTFDTVLSRYVSEDGLVDYKGLKKDDQFEKYIEYLSHTDPDDLPSDKHRLAFWINAYNAFVLQGVLEEYPIKSVLDIGLMPHSFFKQMKFETNTGGINLRVLENEKLREAFREPRIHFAINCASMSCPKLLKDVYVAEKLDQQLEAQTKAFINNKTMNFLDREKGVLYLSQIFKWYEGDFIQNGEKIESYVLRYLNREDGEFIKSNEVAIKYIDYDWGLNTQ